MPKVNGVFTDTVLDVDETAVLVRVPGFAQTEAVICAENLAGKRYDPGNPARVQVIRASKAKAGRHILELLPRPKATSNERQRQ